MLSSYTKHSTRGGSHAPNLAQVRYGCVMSSSNLISTAEAASILGVSPRAIAARVARGTLAPRHRLPGRTGAMVFDRREIERQASATRVEADDER